MEKKTFGIDIEEIFMHFLIALGLIAFMLYGLACQRLSSIEHHYYTARGNYYTTGEIITSDGNIWKYKTHIIGHEAVYDGMPILISFDDNGTGNIEDDIVVCLAYDY